MPPSNENDRRRKLKWIFAGILVLVSTIAYDPSRMENSSGDSISTRYWPVALLKHHTYLLNPFSKDLDGVAFASLYTNNGNWLPRVTLGMGVFTIPFYAVADWTNLGGEEWTHDRISYVSRWNAIFLAVWSVLGLYLLLVKFVPLETAFASAALFAFGTWNWSLGAQGLSWQTAAVLMLVWHMHLVWRVASTKNRDPLFGYSLLLGLLHALLWATRPADIFFVLPAFVLLRNRRALTPYFIGLAVILIPLLQMHQEMYWNPLGFYGLLYQITYGNTRSVWRFNLPEGMLGLLFSPNRGAVTFFPALLLTPYLWYRLMPSLELKAMVADLRRFRLPAWDGPSRNGVPQAFANALAWGTLLYFLSTCNLDFWHSTWSYGCRYLYDLQPFVWPAITLGIHETWLRIRAARAGTSASARRIPAAACALLVAASGVGVLVHWLGHENADLWVWNSRGGEVTNARAWDFNDFVMTEVWRAGSNKHRYPDALKRLKEKGF